MRYRVKKGHLLYYAGKKYKAGVEVDLTEELGQRWHALVEPVESKAKTAPEKPQEPAVEPERAVEGEDAPKPKTKRRRRSASA